MTAIHACDDLNPKENRGFDTISALVVGMETQ
jgi:hypothetical protein